jgi:hypothetical protein
VIVHRAVFPASLSVAVVVVVGFDRRADRGLQHAGRPAHLHPGSVAPWSFSLRRAGFPSRRKDAAQADQRHLTTHPHCLHDQSATSITVWMGRGNFRAADSRLRSRPGRSKPHRGRLGGQFVASITARFIEVAPSSSGWWLVPGGRVGPGGRCPVSAAVRLIEAAPWSPIRRRCRISTR